jgi:hypothetical protein
MYGRKWERATKNKRGTQKGGTRKGNQKRAAIKEPR